MKKFLYIVYLGFLVGAARRFSKLVKMGVGMRLRDTYLPPGKYEVSLAYKKILWIDIPDGGKQPMYVLVSSGITRTFVCKRAEGFFDVTLILRERMTRYISRHCGSLDLEFSLESDYTSSPYTEDWAWRLIRNGDSYDVRCINKAFEAMPREL